MRIADDKGDGHGFPQGPAQSQEKGPDDAHQAIRDSDFGGHLQVVAPRP